MRNILLTLGLLAVTACGSVGTDPLDPVIIPDLPGGVFSGFTDMGYPTYVSTNPVLYIGATSASGSH